MFFAKEIHKKNPNIFIFLYHPLSSSSRVDVYNPIFSWKFPVSQVFNCIYLYFG